MQLTAPQPQYAFAPVMMAEGGLAAAQQAQQVKAQGRGDDSMLVHMTPGEVKGLQALAMAHGGSLTINPDTGLPEAGFLKKILPMIAGAALTIGTGGAVSPLMAGLLVGGGTGLATGSLKKGLMAGLGAYGGAGLGAGLTAAGAAGGAEAVGSAGAGAGAGAVPVAPPVAPPVVTPPTPPVDFTSIPAGTEVGGGIPLTGQAPGAGLRVESLNLPQTSALTPTPVAPQVPQVPQIVEAPVDIGFGADRFTPEYASADVAGMPSSQFRQQMAGVYRPTGLEALKQSGQGLRNVFDMGTTGTEARAAFMKGLPTGTLPTAGTTLASALAPEPEKLKKQDEYEEVYSYDWNKQPDAFNPPASPGAGSYERTYFDPRYTFIERRKINAAGGGLMGLAAGGTAKRTKKDRSLAGEPFYKFAQDRRDASMEAAVEQNFAKGGLGTASKSLPPRFLEGAGDGMSDSIKARIGGVQEARLADGEFVVPADVVSHLGNGSSKAGAKKLYAMMDKIRKARTGNKRQAPEVNASKYMPA